MPTQPTLTDLVAVDPVPAEFLGVTVTFQDPRARPLAEHTDLVGFTTHLRNFFFVPLTAVTVYETPETLVKVTVTALRDPFATRAAGRGGLEPVELARAPAVDGVVVALGFTHETRMVGDE